MNTLDTDKINFHAVSESSHISELIAKGFINNKNYNFDKNEFVITSSVSSESDYLFKKIHYFLIEDNNISLDAKLKIIEGVKSLFLNTGKAVESLISDNQSFQDEYQNKKREIKKEYDERIRLAHPSLDDDLREKELSRIAEIKITITDEAIRDITRNITDLLIKKSKEYINSINSSNENAIDIEITPADITPENIKNNITNINKSKTKHSSLKQ